MPKTRHAIVAGSLRQTWRRRPLSHAFNLREATREKRMAAARRPHRSMSERGSLTESELPSEQPSDAESVYGRDREWELGMDLDSVTHSPGKEAEFRVGSEATGAGREPLDDDDVYRRRLASESQPKDGRASGQSQETSATTPKPFPSHPSSSTIRSVIDLPEAEQEVWECLCHGRLKLNPDVVRLQAIRFLFIFYVIIMIASIVRRPVYWFFHCPIASMVLRAGVFCCHNISGGRWCQLEGKWRQLTSHPAGEPPLRAPQR